jgi:excisionase family DNA binding protein
MSPENEKLLVSINDAARMLSVSRRSIEYLIAKKELAVRKIGRRTLVTRASLHSLAARDVASPSARSEAR